MAAGQMCQDSRFSCTHHNGSTILAAVQNFMEAPWRYVVNSMLVTPCTVNSS